MWSSSGGFFTVEGYKKTFIKKLKNYKLPIIYMLKVQMKPQQQLIAM